MSAKLLIGLLIAVGIIGGAYYFGYDHGWEKSVKDSGEASGSTEVVRWKTHTDTKYGFSVNYPDSWAQPVFNESSKNLHLSYRSSDAGSPNKKFYEVAIYIEDYSFDSIYETLERYPNHTKPIVAGNQAYRIEKFGLDVPRINTIVASNTYIYNIELIYNSDEYLESDGWDKAKKDFPEAEEIYNQILATFKFTNE